jgi:hypothetical protein
MFHIQLSLIGTGSMKFIYVNVSPQDIVDRVCALALNMVLIVDDSQLQKCHDQAERMILSTFISALAGNPGQQVRFGMPESVEEAVQIAVTVYEAQRQERRNQEFFSNMNDSGGHDLTRPLRRQGSIRGRRQPRKGRDSRPNVGRQPVRKVNQVSASCFMSSCRQREC